MKFIKYTAFAIMFLVLTVLTQVGGLALLLGVLGSKYLRYKFNRLILTVLSYLILTWLIVPIIASWLGREKVKHTDSIQPTTYLTVLMNRNYVKPELNELLQNTSKQLNEGVEIRYLDANFPFFDGFPLLPHLSHNDGKKIDVSLMYVDHQGITTNFKPSRSGYGCFEDPYTYEFDQTSACKNMGYWQYDFPKYLTLGLVNPEIRFSSLETKNLIKAILTNSNLSKLFVERHLVDRMKLQDSRIRFHGCRAVRHDDHIHVQIK